MHYMWLEDKDELSSVLICVKWTFDRCVGVKLSSKLSRDFACGKCVGIIAVVVE